MGKLVIEVGKTYLSKRGFKMKALKKEDTGFGVSTYYEIKDGDKSPYLKRESDGLYGFLDSLVGCNLTEITDESTFNPQLN